MSLAGETVFEGLSVAMRFEVTKRQLDLHAAGVNGHDLRGADGKIG